MELVLQPGSIAPTIHLEDGDVHPSLNVEMLSIVEVVSRIPLLDRNNITVAIGDAYQSAGALGAANPNFDIKSFENKFTSQFEDALHAAKEKYASDIAFTQGLLSGEALEKRLADLKTDHFLFISQQIFYHQKLLEGVYKIDASRQLGEGLKHNLSDKGTSEGDHSDVTFRAIKELMDHEVDPISAILGSSRQINSVADVVFSLGASLYVASEWQLHIDPTTGASYDIQSYNARHYFDAMPVNTIVGIGANGKLDFLYASGEFSGQPHQPGGDMDGDGFLEPTDKVLHDADMYQRHADIARIEGDIAEAERLEKKAKEKLEEAGEGNNSNSGSSKSSGHSERAQEILDQIAAESDDPIILDLTGNGIQITELQNSTHFVDATGDGLLNRTAWAAAGNAVLFFDADNDGTISEKTEYVFTEWDPAAGSDMEALASVFDTNGDGILDANDADFASFKLLVTNEDGSTSAKTLAELNIVAINLNGDTTHIELPDGSVITGQSTFVYADGTTSGGTLERPALQQLMADVEAGRVDQIVVYKIDRLTRSLADFAKIVDVLDAAEASFVSVTQSFNTATSMGRLTLNMLLSFAQFEREVTAERPRDKIAASKRKGLWMGGNVPLGYDPDGRTLRINVVEAETVRCLYDLYETHRVLRKVKDVADERGLTTKRRIAPDGTGSGGQPFSRGHIHHILTNPIYAGRIRHKGKVHEGHHEAIIDPGRWDAIQVRMQDGAARPRKARVGRPRKTQKSLLTGKLFDETGDRLTPSHSKSKTGARLRYYISHRLVARSGEATPDGWRLPAAELEGTVSHLVRDHLTKPEAVIGIVPDCPAADVQAITKRLAGITASDKTEDTLSRVNRIDLAPGKIAIALCPEALAEHLDIDLGRIAYDFATIRSPFQTRKRGVETRIILNSAAREVDETLLANIANAPAWYGMFRSGKTFAEISRDTGISKRRIQQMLDLAFLAPETIRDVIDGRQLVGFTSDWCLRHELPSDWQAQRDLIATL